MSRISAQQAVREKIYVKVNLASPAGGGKTYGALLMATGMAKEIEKETGKPAKILMGNSEASRGKYYANEFKYDIADLSAPFNPELYVELIDYAIDNGYSILVIDSASHEWDGKGGCLELQQEAGGTFQAWKRVTPRHQAFLEKLVFSPIHIIATSRSKSQYEIDKDEKGKTSVTKVGTASHQREGYDFEFTCYFNIDVKSHMCSAEKDNTHLFGNGDFMISEKTGVDIIKWANSSNIEPQPHPINSEPAVSSDALSNIKKDIVALCKELGGTKNAKLMETLKAVVPSGNPNAIKDIDKARELLNTLKNMSEEG